jgi:hypothetical protein
VEPDQFCETELISLSNAVWLITIFSFRLWSVSARLAQTLIKAVYAQIFISIRLILFDLAHQA